VNEEIEARLEDSFRREDHAALIAEAVERTVRALQAIRESQGPAPPPAPPSYGGILGQLTTPEKEKKS
jgi:hypothetical protein